jgi:hypothetical protein
VALGAPGAEPCVNCREPVAAEFCGQCGERRRTPDALSLRHLATEAFEHATSLDLRLLRTLVALVRRPGEPTRAYVAGARRRHTPPLQLFLLLNVVFFLAAPRLGLFRYQIDAQYAEALAARVNGPPSRYLASRVMIDAVRRSGGSATAFRARYNAAVESRTRSMASIFIAWLSVLLLAAYARRGRYLAEHVVFATHYFTFALLYVPVLLLPQRAALDWMERRGTPIVGAWVSLVLIVTMTAGLYAYLAIALRRVYGDRWLPALLRAAALLAAFLVGGGVLFNAAVMFVTALLL